MFITEQEVLVIRLAQDMSDTTIDASEVRNGHYPCMARVMTEVNTSGAGIVALSVT